MLTAMMGLPSQSSAMAASRAIGKFAPNWMIASTSGRSTSTRASRSIASGVRAISTGLGRERCRVAATELRSPLQSA